MNKLWVRLSLAFSSVVLVAVLLIVSTGALLAWLNRPENFRPESLSMPNGLVETLSDYYRQRHSWNGAGPLLRGAQTTFRAERGPALLFFLADADRRVIYHDRPGRVGQPLDQVERIQLLPIQVEGQTVGYLGVASRFPQDRPVGAGPPPVDRLVGWLLILALAGGIVGIIYGVLISRSLTAPLNRLAEAARSIGARNLSRRVAERGSDELVAVARAFNDMAANLEAAEQLRRNLVADVAHELRTPLTVLQGNLRAILDEVYPLDKSEVARLYEQTRLLSRLVNDLHELAQAEAKQLPLNLQPTDPTQLIQTIGDTFRPAAEAKAVMLRTDLADSLPPIEVDPARLSQVLHNLLANALRHTPGGGAITLGAAPENGALRLTVADTGEGIPAEHLPHIFDRFYRADPARSRDRGGAGLGLAIARAIVEAHGGAIEAASAGAPGQGTTFTIRLPVGSGLVVSEKSITI
jgi:signal transduction histidine kinase